MKETVADQWPSLLGAGLGVGVDKIHQLERQFQPATMETELRDKELKDEEIKPVAGSIYFPITTKQKVGYQLEYHGTDAVTNLPLKSH